MSLTSIGNLSLSHTLRQMNLATKSDILTHTRDLTTGIRDDIVAALGGDTRGLGQIETRLRTLSAYDQSGADFAREAQGMQHVLDTMQAVARSLGANLIEATTLPSLQSVSASLAQAHERLGDVIGQLNMTIGDRFLFSGTDVTKPPLPSIDDFLGATRLAIGAPANAADLIAAVTAFFDAPAGAGGFTDTVYQGNDGAISTLVGSGQTAMLNANATSPAVRDLLKGMTLLALAAEAPWAGDTQTQARIISASGEALLTADSSMSMLRGEIGSTESTLASTQARNSAESTALKLNRNTMIGADQYEAASALAEAHARMEAIYSLTARLSRLSLAAYL